MEIRVTRASVCIGDNVEDHARTLSVAEGETFRGVFYRLIADGYFPQVAGNDVVWLLFCAGDDIAAWLTKHNGFYTRFVDDEEPPISRIARWWGQDIHFAYYSSPLQRAEHLFKHFGGKHFHIWHEGFMPEYQAYGVSKALEAEWLRQMDGQGES